ncbi:MAG: hypothetical protein WBA31_06315 [Candidatus Dormiibacterota bacterium]
MNLATKRFGLVLAGVVTVGAIGSLALGASFALFSSNVASAPNSFAAGTVTLGPNTTTGYVTCTETNLAAGDSSAGYPGGNQVDPTCDSSAVYSGSLNAYIGAQISFTSTSAAGGYALINNNDPNASSQEIQFNGHDPWSAAWTSTDSSLTVNCGTNSTTQVQTCTGSTQIYVVGAAGPDPNPSGIANLEKYYNIGGTEGSVAANLDYYLPLASGNGYQGSSATVTITFFAVQCSNNASGDPSAANADCSAGNAPIAWS